MIRIVQKRSAIGILPKQRKVLQALGLRKIGASVVKKDDKAIQGMIHQVVHLVSVEKAD